MNQEQTDSLLFRQMEKLKLDIEGLLLQLYNAEEEEEEFESRARLQSYIVMAEHIDTLYMQIRREISQIDQNEDLADSTRKVF